MITTALVMFSLMMIDTGFEDGDAVKGMIYMWFLSAALGSMPPPGENAPYLLKWLFEFAQKVVANFQYIRDLKRGGPIVGADVRTVEPVRTPVPEPGRGPDTGKPAEPGK